MKNSVFLLTFIAISFFSCKKTEEITKQEPINCNIKEKTFIDEDITVSLNDIQVSFIRADIEIYYSSFVDENIGYCIGSGFDDYGLWKTVNGGENWQLIHQIRNRIIVDMQFVSEKTGFVLLFEATENQTGQLINDIILRIENDQVVDEKIITTGATEGQISFINEDIGVVTTNREYIYTTTNGGEDWRVNNVSTSDFSKLISYKQKIYLQGSFPFLESSDCGQTWTKRNYIDLRGTNLQTIDKISNYADDFYIMGVGGLFKTDSSFAVLTKQSSQAIKDWEIVDKNTIIGIKNNQLLLSNDEGKNWISKNINDNFGFTYRVKYCQWINPKMAYLLSDDYNLLTKITINK